MLDEIITIEKMGISETLDIEVNGNHLFYANEILTHNSSSDVELTDTSESFGLPATADFMFALIATEELDALAEKLNLKDLLKCSITSRKRASHKGKFLKKYFSLI